eukprot:TRINITY_DN2049_c1_g1_i1.p1 TRINITY_DN2049_c1_g1~~TRINITY_DN2049_c1_g1_i1.p1  ORF type:complete len:638 (+),score=172.27 TRINITY_DN2049_c1_g1_i1:68-1915(+)
MVFTILAAADLFGNKVNYELDFPHLPTMIELREKVEAIFGSDANLRRPAGVPASPFAAHRMQTFDDRVELWVDLINENQLQDYSQVYVFQRETQWHKEVQSKIPPPIKAPAAPLPVPVPVPPVTMPFVPVPALPSGSPALVPSVLSASPLPTAGDFYVPPPSIGHAASLLPPVASVSPAAEVVPVPVAAVDVVGEASHIEKVRIVFDELDATRQRAIGKTDWVAGFLRVQLSEYAADLFEKTALGESVVSFEKFQRFCEIYPTVLDSLYYRSRDYWLMKRQDDSITASQKTLEVLREKESEARSAVAKAMADAALQEEKVAVQSAEVSVAQNRERDALAVLEAAGQETERARQSLTQHAAELVATREKEAIQIAALAEAQQAAETCNIKKKMAAEETARAQARLQEIMKLLEEAQGEVAKRQELEAQAGADAISAEATVTSATVSLETAQTDTKLAHDRLTVAEQELVKAQERERECGVVHIQAKDECIRQLAKKESEEHELLICKERVNQRKVAEDASSRAVESQNQAVLALETEKAELQAKCDRTRTEEMPLLDQEVRLRAARDNLEAEEARLRTDHQTFHTTTGRANLPSPRGVIPSVVPTESFASPYRGLP